MSERKRGQGILSFLFKFTYKDKAITINYHYKHSRSVIDLDVHCKGIKFENYLNLDANGFMVDKIT